MFRTIWRDYQVLLVLTGYALFAFGGWGGLIYVALSSRGEFAQLREERDATLRDYARFSKTAGDLTEVETKLSRAKAEYVRTSQALADAKQKLNAVQDDLATARRPDPLADLISQTGSVRPQPPKPPPRKITN